MQDQITLTDAKAWLLLADESGIYASTLLDELDRLQTFEAKTKEVNRRRASAGGRGAMTPARKAAQMKAVQAALTARRDKAARQAQPTN